MLKMSTDAQHAAPHKYALNGPTMGTRWSAVFHAGPGFDPVPVQLALQAAVDRVDAQMSTWKPDSALMRFNLAPLGAWQIIPPDLVRVVELGLGIGRASGGAFDIGMGKAVSAWGFGPAPSDPAGIRAAMASPHQPAHDMLEIDGTRLRKLAPIALDLNGIAKGYGVDILTQTLRDFGLDAALVGIDGDLRAHGLRPDAEAWTVAIEAPDPLRRAPQAMLTLQDAAVATSGDYRHWVEVQGRRLSHTMDPRRGAPLLSPPASVTVIAPTCAEADGWATALMVAGPEAGAAMVQNQRLSALYLLRDPVQGVYSMGFGPLFPDRVAGGATPRPSQIPPSQS